MELTKEKVRREFLDNLIDILSSAEQTIAAIEGREFTKELQHRWNSTRELYGTDTLDDELAKRVNAVTSEAFGRIIKKYNVYTDMMEFENGVRLSAWKNQILAEETKGLVPQGAFETGDMSFNQAMVRCIEQRIQRGRDPKEAIDGFILQGVEEKIIIDESKRSGSLGTNARPKSGKALLLLGAVAAATTVVTLTTLAAAAKAAGNSRNGIGPR